MTTIQAVWKNGVFAPAETVDLEEGVQVELQISPGCVPGNSASGESRVRVVPVPLPDPPFETEEQSAPFDLPMPPGRRVSCRVVDPPLPEAHDIPDGE